MTANTRYFGPVDYEEPDILKIPEGLFGFEDQKQFLLIHFANEEDLLCLQSIQNEALAFVVINPFSLMSDYAPSPTEEDMKALNLTEESTITYYAFCAIGEQLKDSTVNLKSPLLINAETRYARQLLLENPDYCFSHSLQKVTPSQKEEMPC